jgi:lysozyme family protein
MTIADAINETLDRESGEFTNNPRDPGGATKWGITLKTARKVYGDGFTVEQLQRLTREQAFGILLHEYLHEPKFDQIRDERVRFIVFDFGVIAGQPTAAKSLQRVLGVDVDGIVGAQTLAAINGIADADRLEAIGNAVAVDRALYCARLVQNDVNAFLKRFELMKRNERELVRRYFPTRRDELDVAAFNYGWIRRALCDVA